MNINFFSNHSLLFLKNKKNVNKIFSLSILFSIGLMNLSIANATLSASKSNHSKLDIAHESVLKDYNDNKIKLSASSSIKNKDPLGELLIEKALVVSNDVSEAVTQGKQLKNINSNQKLIVNHITNKYKNLNKDTAEKIVVAAYAKADKYNIDPKVLIAIAGVESNYNPKVVNRIGASGLTQVVKKYHKDKIKKVNDRGGNILNISDNLDLGAEIYSDLYHKYGNHTSALQAYNGSLKDKSRTYSKKVIKELNDIKKSLND